MSALPTPPVALTIAGSDPSGGAGIQADLKTFSALGAFGTSVITALTAQNTRGVTGVHPVPTDFVADQLETLLSDVRIDSVKIGMLATAELADLVGDHLRREPLRGKPIVLDPVMVATSGDRLLDDDAVEAVRRLFPLVSVITPNAAEAGVLVGQPEAADLEELRAQALALLAAGAPAVLVKGGHLPGPESTDLWVDEEGELVLSAARVDTTNTHGTGCTLSSALAALRPRHEDWRSAAREAKAWLTQALREADSLMIGRPGGEQARAGHGPVHHFHESPRWRA